MPKDAPAAKGISTMSSIFPRQKAEAHGDHQVVSVEERGSAMTSPAETEINRDRLTLLAETINVGHAMCETAARQTLECARKVGESLIAAKRILGHGEFGTWVSTHCAVTARQARRYMKIARELAERLKQEPNRTCSSDLSFAAALRLIGESRVPAKSVLRMDQKSRRNQIETWDDLRWSRFIAFSWAKYSPAEIASIFDWPLQDVIADLARLKDDPTIPNRSVWFESYGLDSKPYHDCVHDRAVRWQSVMLRLASYSAEKDLGKRRLAARLRRASEKLETKSVFHLFGFKENPAAWKDFLLKSGLTCTKSGWDQMWITIECCAWCDLRTLVGFEKERPMDEVFQESFNAVAALPQFAERGDA